MEDVKISGTGNLTGGEYRTVTVNGMGRCTSLIRAQSITANGTFKVDGSTECGELAVNGTFKGDGTLSAERVVCNGMANVDGGAVINDLTVGGTFHVHGPRLEGGSFSCSGFLTADGELLCDMLQVTGIVKAGRIVAKNVRINSRIPSFLRKFTVIGSRADFIQGERVDLDGVKADRVVGVDVTVGPGCSIGHVECSGTLFIDPSAVVETVSGNYERR